MQAEKSWLASTRARFENFLAGRAPSDPLYLSNRTWKDKLRFAGMIVGPIVVVALIILFGVTDPFHLIKADPYEHVTKDAPQPVAAVKPVPEPKLVPKDLEVVNIKVQRDAKPPVVTGSVRNNTNAAVDSLEISYYLADAGGSMVGAESTEVHNLGPHASLAFRAPVRSAQAQYVIVRDVKPN